MDLLAVDGYGQVVFSADMPMFIPVLLGFESANYNACAATLSCRATIVAGSAGLSKRR